MKRFTFFEHTADTMFQAYGKTLEEAFVNAALATTNVMCDVDKVQKVVQHNVEVSAPKLETLLFDFLQEIIILLDTEGLVVGGVSDLEISQTDGTYRLTATFHCDSGDNYEIHTHIKAVTYSEMFIKEEDGLFTVQVVHDL